MAAIHRLLLFVLLHCTISHFNEFTVHAATPPSELFSGLVAQKVSKTASNLSTPAVYPQYTDASGQWLYFPADTWTSSFFPATLYALNTRASLCPDDGLNSTDWLGEARRWSAPETSLESKNTVGHDVGFLSFPFQEELSLDSTNQTAINAVNAFANDLAARFNPTVGCTRSWDTADPTDFTVIIDNMMNLNLLFISANLTGNDTLRQIAISHANKTMQNHVRSDGSSFHVVEYNETTGAVIRQRTAQGYADNSTWSRGQSWGIYAFAQMYQNTGDQRYLDTSRRMATYFTDNLPSSGIVPWDFNAPDDGSRPADTSAAMITTSGMLLLADLEQALSPANTSGAELWKDTAIQILANTTGSFWKPDWQSLLSNGTVDNPGNPPNNDTGIVYGDYYFVKVGNDLLTMGLANCSSGSSASANATTSSPGSSKTSSSASAFMDLGVFMKFRTLFFIVTALYLF
ncbi:d-4,5 unsaturated-glucuronyl hydrolase-like protein [Phellopilus nigrolimitatus]|nr:d-4,5 unsaturated-glucuronyl hydrolase-like protein [Phellopilus nigrolimitatus]